MRTKKIFTGEDFWAGGHFGLLLSYPNESQNNIKEIMDFLWNNGIIEGPYHSHLKEPNEQRKTKIEYPNGDLGPIDYGIISLPKDKKAPCQVYSYTMIEEHYFISIDIPMGAMDGLKLYPVGAYPFGTKENHSKWILELSDFYFNLAKKIFKVHKFDKAIIGYFVDDEKFLEDKNYKIPKERYIGYLINKNGKLEWYPPNVFKGQFT